MIPSSYGTGAVTVYQMYCEVALPQSTDNSGFKMIMRRTSTLHLSSLNHTWSSLCSSFLGSKDGGTHPWLAKRTVVKVFFFFVRIFKLPERRWDTAQNRIWDSDARYSTTSDWYDCGGYRRFEEAFTRLHGCEAAKLALLSTVCDIVEPTLAVEDWTLIMPQDRKLG